MMPQNHREKDVTSILTNSKQLDRVIVSVSEKDRANISPDKLCAFSEDFASELLSRDSLKYIDKIETKQEDEKFTEVLEVVQQNLPLLLDEKDYEVIDSSIQINAVKSILAANYRTLASPSGIAMKQILLNDPLGLSYIALKKLNTLQQDENSTLYDGYILTADQRALTFFIHPTYNSSETKKNEGLSKLLAEAKNKTLQRDEYRDLEVDYFGAQLVAASNASQMRSDTLFTLSITIILLLILFIVFFRNIWAPLQIMIPVLFGGLFGMAMMFVFNGKVSMIALGASSVILGIAVNYSLHFLSHFRHSRDKAETIQALWKPMTIGSFTTIAAFLSLQLLHTPVLQELGLFAAFNLIGSSLCTLFFLPHFIQNDSNKEEIKTTNNWLDRLSAYYPNKNKWIVLSICLFTLVMAFFADDVRFNEDMMKMNYMSKELAQSQSTINKRNAASLNSLFYVSEGQTKEEALQHNQVAAKHLEKLKNNGQIRTFTNIGNFILSDAKKKEHIDRWNAFWTSERKKSLIQLCLKEGANAGFGTQAFSNFSLLLNKQYDINDNSLSNTFNYLFKDFIVQDSSGYKIMMMIKATQEKRSGVYQACASLPNGYLTDRQLITSTFVKYVREDFYNILFLTSFIVFFTILISYGRIELALISFIPMVITWICILGLMGLFGIEFNIINIIIATLIFGLGDDFSIFITDGLLEKYTYGKQKITSIKTSVYLSAITTIIGLGILIIAKHPALRSIALVSVIGIFSILIVSQTLQPLLFNFFIQNRTDKKQHPFTLWSFTKTIFAFIYYVVGCTVITIVGFILTKCIPFAKDKMKYYYHVIVCKGMWSLLYIMGNTKKNIFNKEFANFNSPSVIIANHSSFLDLLRIISLHPKILLMTNKWVWRSPVFGFLVRMADYYPVEEGAEFSIDRLKYWVDRGYTIAVFPEGTRSYDETIKRFHKGAFYIAEKLNLPIQPILFQGIGYTMSKGDFLLKDGEINIKFLPRIDINNNDYGTAYTERAKLIGRYFRNEYQTLQEERKTTSYFKEQLIKNYVYKGPVLEWYCRIKIKLENYYKDIEKLVAKDAKVLDIGCGYGFLAHLLHWTSEDRIIDAIDYDIEKINVAKRTFSKNQYLQFSVQDATELTLEKKYDNIIMLDVLHYFTSEKQQLVLDKVAALLNENGTIIIRDGLLDGTARIKGTQLTEFFSTKLFKFNQAKNKMHYLSLKMIESYAQKYNLILTVVDEAKYTANVLMILRKNKS